MPTMTIHCKLCGKGISGYDFAERMAKLRRHRAKYHPAAFWKSVNKSVSSRER